MAFKTKEQKQAYERDWYAKQSPEKKKHIIETKNTRRNKLRKMVFDILAESECCQCGYKNPKNPAALQFHHRDPSKKVKSVCDMVRCGFSEAKIRDEIKKCDILCANCHAEETAGQFGWCQYGD